MIRDRFICRIPIAPATHPVKVFPHAHSRGQCRGISMSGWQVRKVLSSTLDALSHALCACRDFRALHPFCCLLASACRHFYVLHAFCHPPSSAWHFLCDPLFDTLSDVPSSSHQGGSAYPYSALRAICRPSAPCPDSDEPSEHPIYEGRGVCAYGERFSMAPCSVEPCTSLPPYGGNNRDG